MHIKFTQRFFNYILFIAICQQKPEKQNNIYIFIRRGKTAQKIYNGLTDR